MFVEDLVVLRQLIISLESIVLPLFDLLLDGLDLMKHVAGVQLTKVDFVIADCALDLRDVSAQLRVRRHFSDARPYVLFFFTGNFTTITFIARLVFLHRNGRVRDRLGTLDRHSFSQIERLEFVSELLLDQFLYLLLALLDFLLLTFLYLVESGAVLGPNEHRMPGVLHCWEVLFGNRVFELFQILEEAGRHGKGLESVRWLNQCRHLRVVAETRLVGDFTVVIENLLLDVERINLLAELRGRHV